MPISTQPSPQFPLIRSNLVVLGQNFCTSNSPCYILDPHLHTTNLPLPDFHAKQPGNVLGQNFHARTSLSHNPMPSFIQPFPIPVMRSNLVVLDQNFCTSNPPCYIPDPPSPLPGATW